MYVQEHETSVGDESCPGITHRAVIVCSLRVVCLHATQARRRWRRCNPRGNNRNLSQCGTCSPGPVGWGGFLTYVATNSLQALLHLPSTTHPLCIINQNSRHVQTSIPPLPLYPSPFRHSAHTGIEDIRLGRHCHVDSFKRFGSSAR